jgi:Rad3-related DNA helicase
VGLSGLTEEEVLAIAEHEHIPEIAASALGQYLSRQEHGIEQIRDMIVHDIRQAQQGQDKQHIVVLLHVLHHFLKAHPLGPSQSASVEPPLIEHSAGLAAARNSNLSWLGSGLRLNEH